MTTTPETASPKRAGGAKWNRFQRIDGTGIIRDDGIGPLSGERQWIHVARIGDLSAQRINGYDSECGWCYLGAGHSQEAHAARVSR